MTNLKCEEIIDEIKEIYSKYHPDMWFEIKITSWKEFDITTYSSQVVSVDKNYQIHILQCYSNGATLHDLNGKEICGTQLSETGATLIESLTRLLKLSKLLVSQNITIFEC